jgi:hypothetical protein
VVRGPAAVLGLLALAQTYVLVAPDLPVITPVDLSLFVAGTCGTAVIYICVAAVVPLSDLRPLLLLVGSGAIVLVAGLDAADVGAAATPIEAIAYGSIGALFAVGLLAPATALALPVLVAAIDLASTLGGGPSSLLAGSGQTQPGDPLSLELPDWGTGLPAGRIGLSDPVFAAVFLVYARRFGLRVWPTAIAMWIASVAAVGLKLWLDATIPVLPLTAAAYFLVNADRLPALVAAARR